MLFELTTPHLMIIDGSTETPSRGAEHPRAVYSRTIFALIDCPPVAQGLRYILVGRDDHGRTTALGIGRALSGSETLNLAEIRHQAASLGASEVHVLVRA